MLDTVSSAQTQSANQFVMCSNSNVTAFHPPHAVLLRNNIVCKANVVIAKAKCLYILIIHIYLLFFAHVILFHSGYYRGAKVFSWTRHCHMLDTVSSAQTQSANQFVMCSNSNVTAFHPPHAVLLRNNIVCKANVVIAKAKCLYILIIHIYLLFFAHVILFHSGYYRGAKVFDSW